VAPSDKFSTLRGLASAAGSSGGSGENNLAFKCTRKRLIFETLHLDLEGGVSERRTTPATVLDVGDSSVHDASNTQGTSKASVQIELEEVPAKSLHMPSSQHLEKPRTGSALKTGKTKRKVAFQSDRPDVFDF
jgi:elongator complex protein 4